MAPLEPINNGRAVSRINSYNRTWSTDASSGTAKADPPTSQEQFFDDWSASPPVAPALVQRVMTAHERRMAMIQAALDEGFDDDPLPPPAPAPSRPPKRPADFEDEPSSKKRAMPWEVDHATLKKERNKQLQGRLTSDRQPSRTDQKATLINLSAEQQQILAIVMEGTSVFFTGSAGTGKSVLLREIIKSLRKKYQDTPDAVAITASTGIAACNIGGTTLHSFAGIGLGEESTKDLVNKIKKNKKAGNRWLRTKVLIIDEISMVDGNLFDKLADIASSVRRNPKSFGGIQIIVTGDFFQLPPVVKGQPVFAFEAKKWNECIRRTFNLTKVFRQKDQEFVTMLNEMRFGQLSQKSIAKFKSLSRPVMYDDGIEPTELYPLREDVDKSNRTRMTALDGESRSFYASDGGTIQNPTQREKMLNNLLAPSVLQLRTGAQVMLIKNRSDDPTLVNGSMGRILGFLNRAEWQKRGNDIYNVSDAEEGENKKTKPAKEDPLFPVVLFNIAGYPHGRQILVEQETWKIEQNGEIQASRAQIPLILAWAMSIHKSQGQTLERVKVDLGRAFEMGQAYVALSRATSLEGLQVLRFDASKVKAHPKVTAWSRTLERLAPSSP